VQSRASGVTGPTLSQTVTDAEGFWSVTGVPAGSVHVIAVSRDGRRKGERTNIAAVENAINTVNVTLQARATVRGRVEFANGDPVAGAIVGGGEALVTTDALGAFTVEGVPTGNHSVSAGLAADPQSPDLRRRFARLGSEHLTVLPGDENFAVIRFSPAGRIAGQVLDEAGNPVPNINVAIPIYIDELSGSFMWVRADGSGLFSFDNLGLGSYDLSAPSPPVEEFDSEQAASQILQGDRKQVEAAVKAAFAAFSGASNPLFSGEGDSFNPNNWGFIRDVPLTFDGETVITPVRFLPKASISGVVKNGQGVPIGARVRLTGLGPKPNGEPTMRIKSDIDSDPALGTFSFPNGTFVGDWGLQAANPLFPVVVSTSGRTTQVDPVVTGVVLQFPAVRETNGSLSGQVLNPDGTPAGPDIRVHIDLSNDFFIRTDADGRFATTRGTFTLPARGYTVTALDEITGATGRASAGVQAGQDNTVTVTLLGRGTASVEVRLADGLPAAGAAAEIEMSGFPGGRFEGTTNAAGRIEFPNVFEGAYTACASLTVGATRVAGRTSIQVPRDGLGGGVITLGGTATVRGQFVRTDGRSPIPFANANLAGLAVSPTDAEGRFTLLDVPLGTHRLTVTDPASGRSGVIVVVLTTPNESRDVLVVETALGTVFGLVTNGLGIAPVPNAEIVLILDDPFAVNRRRTVTTAPDGTYSFAAVPAGIFTLTARDPVTGLRGGARATMAPSTGSLEVNLPLQATASATILVLEPDGVTPADATVRLAGDSGGLFADTGPDGRARFENILVLTANSSPYNISATSRRTGETRSVASGSVSPRVRGAEEFATLVLRGVGTVEGQVLQADGLTPAAGAEVRLQMPTGNTETVVATAQGAFQFTNVPVGQSSLSAFSQALGAQSPVTVAAPGATVTQNLVLTASGTVIGRLLRADGTTAAEGADVIITFRSASNADGTFASRLGADGRFSFAPVTAGPFSIAAFHPTVNGLARAAGTITTNGEVVDLGDILLDEAPPTVVASMPGPGDDGVDINSTIEVLFNEALDPSTVDPTGIFLRKATGGPAIPATVTLVAPPNESARRLVLVDPSAPLESETAYQLLAVDGDLRDAFGSITNRGPRDLVGRALVTLYSASFTTRDQRPPVLLSFTPENGAEQVDGRATIRLSIDEPIQAGAVIALTGPAGLVTGTTTLGVNSLVLTFVPTAPLPPNASFTITVNGVQDLAGNPMANQPLSRTFSTLDTLGPVLAELRLKDTPAPLANTPVTLQAVLAATEPGVRVRFSADAVTLATTEVGVLELPVTLPATGAVTYRALAIDRFGNEGPLAELRVTIQENQPPVIAFEKLIPATGPAVLSGSAALIRVTVIDDGSIVTFRAAGTGGWTAPLQTNSTGAPILLSAVVPPTAIPGSIVAVLASATDTAGLSSGERRFELPVADGTAPSLTLVSPAANTSLDPDVPLVLELDVADNSGAATVEIALSGAVTDSRTIEITGPPNAPQRRSAEFDISAAPRTGASLTATARATDATGRSSTVTRLFVVPDLVPPALEFLNPPDGSSDAAITSNVVARFSEPLDPTTVNGDSVRLSAGETPVPGTVTLTGGGRDVSFFPSQALTLDTTYTVTLTSGIRGTDGNPITPVTSTFTVTTGFGITAPAPGTRVIEGQSIPFAAGPATAGFEGVVYSAAGRDLAGGLAPTFGASVTIPSLADLGAPPHLFGGRAFIDDLSGNNLALGQPTIQSSTGFGGPPQLAVDGNRNGIFSGASVTHTNSDLHAWWEVDLGEARDLSLVRIFWRTDCCAERNRVAVLAAETPFNNADFTAAQLPATYSNGAREIYRTTAAFDQNRTSIFTAGRARFIRIAHLATNFLHIAEVEVIGSIEGDLTLSPIVLDVRPATGDEDGDGMNNGAEIAAGLDPFVDDSDLDPDGDGLTNADEVAAGTSPFKSDTDGDGLSDPQELTLGTNPILADTDGDGLRDGLEGTFGTSPLLADTDGDGLSDGFELGLGRISFVNDTARAWPAARDDALARGGHLLTLTSAAENAAFIALFGADSRAPGAWIGHTDRFIEGAFRPVTSEVTTFTHFGPGEPNNSGGNEHAVQLRTDLTWNDAIESSALAAYALEVGFFTDPLLADSDGDGTPDAGDTFPNQPNQAVVTSVDDFSTTAEADRFIAVADLLANDTDPEDDPFDLIAIGQPANGSAVFESAGTQIRYTPPPAFSGIDTFSYTVIEAGGLVGEGLVTIAVGSNRRPLAGAFQRDGFALEFDGTNDFLHIAASAAPALPNYPSWTIEAWVRPASVSNVQFPTLYSSGFWRASLGFRSTNGRLDSWINDTAEVNSTASPTLGDWTHVALVHDGANRQFFINGAPAGSFPSARPTADGQPTHLGAAGGASPEGSSFFSGIMDDVRVWGTARSADEIDANRFAPLTGGEPGLVAYWAFDEGEGAVAGDATGQAAASLGNNTAAAFPTWLPSTSPLFNARQDFGVLTDRATPLVLSGSDPDGNPLTARIVSLPSRGRLFQVAAGGGPGAEIASVPATLTNSSRTVFYQPDSGFTGSDGFAFLIHDGLDESDAAWAMVSVTPAFTPQTDDLWDVSAGATITSSSGFRADAPAVNLLGAAGGVEPGTALFADGQPAGFTHFIEWQTPGFVRLEGARLFAADVPVTGQRGFTEMRLFGRLDAESEFSPLATFRPGAHPYFAGPDLQTSFVFPPTVASQFRAEFDQFGAPPTGGPRVVELDAIGESIVFTAVNNGTPIPLQQATASGTQGGFSPGATIDGNLSAGSGWAGDLGGFTPAVIAVYETVSDVQAAADDEFLFNLIQFFGSGHFIGNFRLSATTDPRSEFADGLATGGDVTANWTALEVTAVSTTGGETVTQLPDGSILIGGAVPGGTTYSLRGKGVTGAVTGFRLELLEHPSLPTNGPGRAGNGNWVLNEFTVAKAATIPNRAPRSLPDAAQTPQGFSVTTGNVLANDFDLEGDPLTLFDFTQPAAGTGSIVLNGDGAFTYTPSNPGFTGDATFTYRATDGFQPGQPATVTVTVNPTAVVAWNNPAGGAWTTASNWTPARVPGPEDNAVIQLPGTYTVTLSSGTQTPLTLTVGGEGAAVTLRQSAGTLAPAQASVIASGSTYELTGGTLAGTGEFAIQGTFLWTGGSMRDAGKTLIAAGATGTISGGANKDLSVDRVLENAGTLTASGGTVFFN
ncbi:MAG: Ig-like domain-containing protein, partial [Verrucomicrobiales bacterium]